MWDRPDLLNRATAALYALAGLLVAYGLVWLVVHQAVFALRLFYPLALGNVPNRPPHAAYLAIVALRISNDLTVNDLAPAGVKTRLERQRDFALQAALKLLQTVW